MKGSIRPPSGNRKSWTATVYTGRDDTGKKTHKWLSAKSEAEIERKVNAVIHDVNDGTYAKPHGTLGEFIERWLSDYARNLSPLTYQGYQSIYRSGIEPALGKVLLRDLKPDRIQRYYSDKMNGKDGKDGDSPTTVRHHHMMLHRCLEYAVKLQLLPRNPCDAVTPPPIQHHQMQTLDESGTSDVLEATKDTPYYALYYCSLHTGMRRSELLALRWQDVDLARGEISVSRAMHQLYSGEIIFRTTKTARSARKIDIGPMAVDVLKAHLNAQIELVSSLKMKFPSERLVFCQWDGKPLLPGTVSQAWRRLMKKTHHTGVRLHDCRHSHASLLLKAGVHPKIVQERLGHASITTTLDLYSHVAPGMQRQAVEAFEELLTRGKRLALASGLANGTAVTQQVEKSDKTLVVV